MQPFLTHATCVAINGQGVLLTGESGSGKSDLALRLLDRGAILVADDQVEVVRDGDTLFATAPQRIAGLLEVRGVGVFSVKYAEKSRLFLSVGLVAAGKVERLPAPVFHSILNVSLPSLNLCAFEASSPLKVEKALSAIHDNSLTAGFLRE